MPHRPIDRQPHVPARGAEAHEVRAWLEASADAHRAWRSTAPEVGHLAVTALCVTNRPEHLADVLANVERQRHRSTRLLLVTNSTRFDRDEVEARVADVGGECLHVDEDAHLGTCLQLALDRCTTRYVAKLDDDDHYGAEYLGDALRAHRLAEACVVGKHSYVAHLLASGQRILRFPGRELEYTSTVAGGTLVVDLEALPAAACFPALDVGEDVAFLESCQRAGASVFAADRFNYVQRRGSSNTWQVDDAAFLDGGLGLDPAHPSGCIDV